jgi:uracil-DNA glycosylase family 4
VACRRCPRLAAYTREVAEVKRRAYLAETYWGRPVPSFGPGDARLLILGLAPGAHGANRTGRAFTGDRSGAFLYPVLYKTGFASQPESLSRDDGLTLIDARIASAVRCAPPDNKPTPDEIRNCRSWLERELRLLTRVKVIVALGKIAFDDYLAIERARGKLTTEVTPKFAHGAEYRLREDGPLLICSYHPSQQNTSTGRLTEPMFRAVFTRAREYLGRDR